MCCATRVESPAARNIKTASTAIWLAGPLGRLSTNPLDQSGVLGWRFRTIDAFRRRPPLQQVVRCGLEQLDAGFAAQPRFEVLLGQQSVPRAVLVDRHTGDLQRYRLALCRRLSRRWSA
jgi:hypothetical protein